MPRGQGSDHAAQPAPRHHAERCWVEGTCQEQPWGAPRSQADFGAVIPGGGAYPQSVSKGPHRRGVDVPGDPALTPADEDVPPDVPLVGGEGEQQQGLQVHALHQQPVEVGQD